MQKLQFRTSIKTHEIRICPYYYNRFHRPKKPWSILKIEAEVDRQTFYCFHGKLAWIRDFINQKKASSSSWHMQLGIHFVNFYCLMKLLWMASSDAVRRSRSLITEGSMISSRKCNASTMWSTQVSVLLPLSVVMAINHVEKSSQNYDSSLVNRILLWISE